MWVTCLECTPGENLLRSQLMDLIEDPENPSSELEYRCPKCNKVILISLNPAGGWTPEDFLKVRKILGLAVDEESDE